MNFSQWLQQEENRGGARRITKIGKLSTKAVNPASPLRPDNLIPRPSPPKGTVTSALNPFKKPKSTVVDPNKK